jgi:hypothetical protein
VDGTSTLLTNRLSSLLATSRQSRGAKLALNRSLTLWSGLLVMVFVCWAWHDSERLWTNAGKGPYALHNACGGLIYGITTPGGFPPGFHFDRRPMDVYKHSPEAFPAPFLLRPRDLPVEESNRLMDRLIRTGGTIRELMTFSVSGRPSHLWLLFIPHWLILLTVAAVWLCLLFWRARRRKGIAIS